MANRLWQGALLMALPLLTGCRPGETGVDPGGFVNLEVWNQSGRELSVSVSNHGRWNAGTSTVATSGAQIYANVPTSAGDPIEVSAIATTGTPVLTELVVCRPEAILIDIDGIGSGRIDINPGSGTTLALACIGTRNWQ